MAPDSGRNVKGDMNALKRKRDSGDAEAEKPKQAKKIPINPAKILRTEEAAFPRGGASVLTPLEYKQIQIEATRDVLFEQGATSSKPNAEDNEGPKRAKKRSKSRTKAPTTSEEAEVEDIVRIESLSYKRIVAGSLVLGQISQINNHDIAVSLPNNLTGYVPITAMSEKITQKAQAMAAAEDEDDSSEDPNNDLDLSKIFFKGQYVRTYVVSTGEETDIPGSQRHKRRIELSIKPEHSNSTLKAQDIVVNNTVMASVHSVEDHGVIMDLAIQGSDMKGFISSKEIGQDKKLTDIQEGAAFLCIIIGLSSNGKTVKLSADTLKFGNLKKGQYLTSAPTIDAFVPGSAVEVLVTEVTPQGIAGKLMGMVDVTADLMHSGAGPAGRDLEKKFKIGSKITGRVICTFPTSHSPKLGISILDHILSFVSLKSSKTLLNSNPLDALPLSSIVEEVSVQRVVDGVGLFVDVGVKNVPGFVHISRVKDGKIDTLSSTTGPYKVDSVHRGRIVGYNGFDGLFLVSFESSILDQPFLRVEDIRIGDVVKGKVEKLILNAKGLGGLLLNLADGISGLVPDTHMSDVQLLHPEKKFKEGTTVTARVLSVDLEKRHIRLTLKKTLVNSDAPLFSSYNNISIGMQSPGTIVKLLSSGAVVRFYGKVQGFLPVAEMSEAYIEDPKQHFRVGQVVNVHVINVNPLEERLIVSCKDPSVFGLAQQTALKNLKVGDLVSAQVTEKSDNDVSVELQEGGIRAVLPVGHLTDGSESKNNTTLKRIRVGQTLRDLVVLEKVGQKKLVVLTHKPSLAQAATDGTLLKSFEDVNEQKVVSGFVKNITATAVYVQFGGRLTGLLPKSKLSLDAQRIPDFGLKKFQSIEVKIMAVDRNLEKFSLASVDFVAHDTQRTEIDATSTGTEALLNAVDTSVSTLSDFAIGKITKARIMSVKDTQINVQLAENVQGRIDISQIFDSWEDIKDRKKPLRSFATKQVLDVRILGIHDARNHRFLPISHRAGKHSVFELSAKPGDLTCTSKEPLSLDSIKIGSSWIAYVNNVADDYLWVNITPNVRGRIRVLDVSENVSLLQDIENSFPKGSAIQVHVVGVDSANNRLDLSGRSAHSKGPLSITSLSKGMILPGRITKIGERNIMVQLSEEISGPVNLVDLADDFTTADPTRFSKGDFVRVCVTEVDKPNKKVRLSMRPSRVLDSSIKVEDPEIVSIAQLKVNDVIRGFIKNITDKGIFVVLGGSITAFVRVSDLSDSFIKDWKSTFEVDQLVKGKLTAVKADSNQVQMSLKASIIDKDYVPPLTFEDLTVGQIVTGKIRKVEDFGVFIVVDGSRNISGLCHSSEIADKQVTDVRKLYDEGDAVKAIVLKKDLEKRRVNFGLKASYFGDVGNESESSDEDVHGQHGVSLDSESEEEGDNNSEDVEMADTDDAASIGSDASATGNSDAKMEDVSISDVPALPTSAFDWTASGLDEAASDHGGDDDGKDVKAKKKRRRAEVQVDRTGDLDAKGPQSVDDFERLLLGQPDSSTLWIQYMAFQMQLSELAKAREVVERAIKTINMREEPEKLNVWIAYLNLENTYGTDETTEQVFKRACQYNDAQEVHERLVSIHILSGKHEKADELFQVLVKKFSQSPTVWSNYAQFLMTTLSSPERARALLSRATQSLPPHTHVSLTLKFAALEFNSPNGSPERGRTIFEGLITTFPKRLDIWNQLLDLEIKQADNDMIRNVFERVTKAKALKAKGAKMWFKKWSAWEEENGDKKSQEKVTARAEEWVRAATKKTGKEDNE